MNATTARKGIDFDRLNHILIPKTRARRERWRKSRAAKLAAPLYALYMRLSAEGRAFAAIAAISSLFALEARRTDAYLLWGVLTALLASSLLFGRTARLEGVRAVVQAPPRITVGDELTFTMTVRNETDRPVESLRFAGPFLPWEGTWLRSRAALALVARGKSERATMRARFRERGEPVLGPFHAAALLPLGLAMGPALWIKAPHFLVVPKRAAVADIVVPRTTRRAVQGTAFSMRAGDSRDFLGVKPYSAGDPLRDLHAKTWARTGVPIVRQYEQEDAPEITVLLDTGVTGSGSADEESFEAAIEVVCGIAEALTRGQARLTGLVTNDTLVLPRAYGHLNVDRVLDAMALVRSGKPFEAARAISQIEPLLKQSSLVLLVCLGFGPEHEKTQEAIQRRGVACRALAVGSAEKGAIADSANVRSMSPEAIRRGKLVQI